MANRGKQLGPGIYEVGNEVHIDAEEICAHFGVPCTEENFATLMAGVQEAVAELYEDRVPIDVRGGFG